MQDMRIRKKKRQTIRPLLGKLFLTKASAASRMPFKTAGAGKPPGRYTRQQVRPGQFLFCLKHKKKRLLDVLVLLLFSFTAMESISMHT